MNKCIYKELDDLRFKKVEHVIPAGLGGTATLPKGFVSDKMNEMFSAVELKALRTSMIAGIRNFVGPGHRGKMRISKKLNPCINILKLKSDFEIENLFKYKMGFMLDRKTIFIPQLLFEFSSKLDIKNVIYSPGGFDNVYNSLKNFLDEISNINYEKITIIETLLASGEINHIESL